MATVTYCGLSFECTTAIKGEDYIHLLDADGVMIVAFDGVSDMSAFAISGGTWQNATPENQCYLAVVKDDGTIGKGSHRCSDIPTKLTSLQDIEVRDSLPESFVEGKWYLVKAEV